MKDDAQQTIYFSNSVVVPENKYEYDALYRLKKATGRQLAGLSSAPSNSDITIKSPVPNSDTAALENYTQSYLYDSNGNMTQMKNVAGSSWTKDFYYEANSNRLDRHIDLGSSAYNYDNNGNLLDGTSIIGLSYNENDQIIEADLGGGGTAYYRYDASGNRLRKVIENGSDKKERIYLNNFEVYIESSSGSEQLVRETVYVTDDRKKFLQLDTLLKEGGTDVSSPTTEWRYQFDNNIGSACLELDDTAAIISYEEYFPFGASSYRSGKSEAEVKRRRFKYTGKERDEETGLYYYESRYYLPWLARFNSTDPLGMVDGASLYAYVRNNPIMLNDPDGMQAGGEDEEVTQKVENKSSNSDKEKKGTGLPTVSIPEVTITAESDNIEELQYSVTVTDANGSRVTDMPPNNEISEFNKALANFLRYSPILGVNIENPFQGAEAIVFDLGGTLTGAERDTGTYFILAGPEAGKWDNFEELAGGVAPELGVGIEVGRVDISGNTNTFTSDMLFGERKKVWLNIGEISVGGAYAWSEVETEDGVRTVTVKSLQLGIGLSTFISPGYNKGEVYK